MLYVIKKNILASKFTKQQLAHEFRLITEEDLVTSSTFIQAVKDLIGDA